MRDGWNLTGDTFVRDEKGRFSFVARSDDMIVSSGYNIAGPEIEAALLTHPAVAECGVVGAPDEARGMIVKAYVVLLPASPPMPRWRPTLQDHVKREIAPYKYPRAIEFVTQLPKTETGKLKRFALRQMAQAGAASAGHGRRMKCEGELSVSMPKGPTLAVLPVTKDETSPAGAQILQPSGWPTPKGYANGMTADGRLVVTGGVIGWDHQGHLPADFVAQVRQTLSNISAILAEGGAAARTPRSSDLVRRRYGGISGQPEDAWPDLSRNLRRALSRHGAGPGRAPG